MATIKSSYGTGEQSITCTMAALANNAVRASASVDNSSNLFLDALVQMVAKTTTSGVSATGVVNLYAYGTVNSTGSAPDWSDTSTGGDNTVTLTAPPNVRLVGVLNCVANATVYKGGPWSVGAAFGGVLPQQWGLLVENKTGAGLSTTSADHKIIYQGILAQTV